MSVATFLRNFAFAPQGKISYAPVVHGVCVCTHTGLHVHIYAVFCPPLEFLIFGTFFGVYERMNVCVCVCLCVYLQKDLCGVCVYIHTGLHVQIYIVLCPPLEFLIFGTFFGLYECMNVCVCACVCVCIYKRICVVSVCIYTQVYMYKSILSSARPWNFLFSGPFLGCMSV